MPETPQEPRHKLSALTTLAVVLATFLLAAAAYVCWQAAHILFPQNVYETALPITTEGMKYGARGVVIGIPVHKHWRSERGLKIAGPRYFGYDFDYIPVEERVASK